MSILKEFENITGSKFIQRQTNHLSDGVGRKDPFFNALAILYISSPRKFNRLKNMIINWSRREHSEGLFALAGYICYITEDFKTAKRNFFKAASLNPDNLDNWIDLAFALRHNGEFEISNCLLFNYDYVIHYYNYLGLAGCDYGRLKNLILEVAKRA